MPKPLLLACFLAPFAFSSATSVAQDYDQQIEALLAKYHEYGLLNGAVLVAEGDEVL